MRGVSQGSRNRDLLWREVQPLWPLLGLMPALSLGLWWFGSDLQRDTAWLLPALPLLLVLGTGRMVTEVYGDRLIWRFGWLRWPRWQADLDDIVAIEPARSRWIEGWGINFGRDGMLYNASGTQAVRLTLRNGRRLRLGSQEPRRLLQALQGRIAGG